MSLNRKKELAEIAKILCRDLRKHSTNVETLLWDELRNRKLNGRKFLRQYSLYYDINGKESFFITDFYCHSEKLIIELGGEYHKYRLTKDKERTEILDFLGVKVIRFSNSEVEQKNEDVLEKIKKEFIAATNDQVE